MSITLTSASLTVGGAATLSVYHPSPPAGLNVHAIRVFLEQTIELYSDIHKGWMKLPAEKLRLWERGFHPYKDVSKQVDPSATMEDSFWISSEDGEAPGHPGRAITQGSSASTLAPFGSLNVMQSGFSAASQPSTPGGMAGSMGNMSLGGPSSTQNDGYKFKSILRLPDDNTIRPSTVRGSRAEVKVTHEIGVEVYFSRLSVLDDREESENIGKPKIQLFTMRRPVSIPSCCATYDTIHLPPYSLESPISSRPPSPTLLSSSLGSSGAPQSQMASRGRQGPPLRNATQSEIDHWKLKQTLKAALGSGPVSTGNTNVSTSGIRSAERSLPSSRNSSPTRSGNGFGGYFGRRSRPASPTGHHSSSSASSFGTSPGSNRRSYGGLHALTPTNKPSPPIHPATSSSGISTPPLTHASTTFPTVTTAPPSGTTTPKTLPPNSPWAQSGFPARSSTSHDSCQCGRSIEELIDAENRLLEGVPTAPGVWVDAHDEGQMPPPWTPSRPSSPVFGAEDVSGWFRSEDGNREGGRAHGKIGEIMNDS